MLLRTSAKYKSNYIFQLYRFCHNKKHKLDLTKTRNIGIMAHIDAGKTTTTERMLYYSGEIKSMGEVHKGNTVTDYMEQERNRGITITSACVTFMWNDHFINLVDTPGHIDFTIEVEQALNVIDSAVIVLDGTAGVEVQTVTVWRQADEKKLPRIVYINKMDRPDSDLDLCEYSLKEKLSINPLLLHLPLKDKSGFNTIVDLISLKKIKWEDGKMLSCNLIENDDVYPLAVDKRNKLIDNLSTFDDNLADVILNSGSFEAVNEDALRKSVRKIALSKQGIPVICGSSYKNVGVEILMDSIIDFLPSPLDVFETGFHKSYKDEFIAKSFKVMHDKQKGPLVFFRMYGGEISKGQKVYDLHQEKHDQIGTLYKAFADELTEVTTVKYGEFFAANGLKTVQNGEILCLNASSAKRLKDMSLNSNQLANLLKQTHIPRPVIFCSIEPPSQAYQLLLEKALAELSREDPSLKVTYDAETGQTILGGMGELHLEIIKDRLRTEYKIDADIGPLQIMYKEKPLASAKETHILKNTVGSSELQVTITMTLNPVEYKDILRLDTSKEASQNLSRITPRQIGCIKQGIESAFSKGPLMSCEVINSHVVLHWLETNKRVPEPVLIAAVSQCIDKLLKLSGTQLLEPVMEVVITVDESYMNGVQADLSRRRANIIHIDPKYNTLEIVCEVPLSELMGYAKYLRTITSGSARFAMEFKCYKEMSQAEQEHILTNLI